MAAAGYTNNGPSYYDFVVVKFDADGTLLWQQTLNGTGNYFDAAFSVAVDNQGNTVAGGWTNLSKDPFPWRFTLTVTKFDRDGTLLWKQDLTSSDSSANRALAVAVDNQGHVFAAGPCGQAFAVVKFAP